MINNLPVWDEQIKVIFLHFVFFFLSRWVVHYRALIMLILFARYVYERKKKLEENVKVESLLLTKTCFHYSSLI